jgi:hypothetical protein
MTSGARNRVGSAWNLLARLRFLRGAAHGATSQRQAVNRHLPQRHINAALIYLESTKAPRWGNLGREASSIGSDRANSGGPPESLFTPACLDRSDLASFPPAAIPASSGLPKPYIYRCIETPHQPRSKGEPMTLQKIFERATIEASSGDRTLCIGAVGDVLVFAR